MSVRTKQLLVPWRYPDAGQYESGPKFSRLWLVQCRLVRMSVSMNRLIFVCVYGPGQSCSSYDFFSVRCCLVRMSVTGKQLLVAWRYPSSVSSNRNQNTRTPASPMLVRKYRLVRIVFVVVVAVVVVVVVCLFLP